MATLAVINRYDKRCILLIILAKLILGQGGEFEIYHAKHDLLLHAWLHVYILNVVVAIWRVEHSWHVVLVLLLGDAGAHAHIAVDLGVDLEG